MGKKEILSGDCASGIPATKTHFGHILPVVKELTSGFTEKHWSSHIEPVPIPSKDAVVDLIKQLQRILFPGYFSNRILSPDSIEYHLGLEVTGLYEALATQANAAIRHDCLRHNQPCSHCGDRSYEVATEFVNSLPQIKELLESDIRATLTGDPAAAHNDEVVFSYPGLFATLVYRVAHRLVELEVPIIPRIMSEYAYHRTTIDIHPGAEIGEAFFIDHGAGVVIGATADIGNRVRIYQGVTLGALSLPRDAGTRLKDVKRHPTIEDDVIIYANATILGGDTVIGKRSIIGGNVWLTESVGPDTKVMLKQPELVYLGKKDKKSL
jgi:serine O-acetyltransferase